MTTLHVEVSCEPGSKYCGSCGHWRMHKGPDCYGQPYCLIFQMSTDDPRGLTTDYQRRRCQACIDAEVPADG